MLASRRITSLRPTFARAMATATNGAGKAGATQSQQGGQQEQQQQRRRLGPLTPKEKEVLDPMIRVDQSGEVGAYYIYMGQMAVLGRDKKLRPILQEMWDQEKHHLERFDQLVGDMRVRPSLLRPLWEVAGFAVGAGTALMGKEAAMACTEAVETVIGNHYDDQLRTIVKMIDANPDLEELGKVRKEPVVSFLFLLYHSLCMFIDRGPV